MYEQQMNAVSPQTRSELCSIVSAKLQALEEEKEAKKFNAQKKGQVGTGDRSEKIRTYNIFQDRITDHRIKKRGITFP
jgi:peptide chain release factor 1